MNLLQVFFIISGLIIFFLALDIARKQKFNALHFIVFILIWLGLLVFTVFPGSLNGIWRFFGLQRWADLLVYSSIVFLIYFTLLLLRKVEGNNEDLTKLIREIAVKWWTREKIHGKEIFLIRSFNEATVISSTIQSIFDAWYKNILVINDGSTDNTNTVIKRDFWDKVILLEHYKNRWAGAALETWFEYVRRYGKVDYVICFDADWQHNVWDVKTFESYLKEHKKVDILLWSRFLKKKQVGMPFARKVILKLGILFTAVLSSIKLTDAHNGFRVIKTDVLDDIHITIDGMGYASELIDIITQKKLVYKEVPVNVKYTKYSLSKGQKNSNAINIAFKFMWSKFFK